jgi:hypothetical protein
LIAQCFRPHSSGRLRRQTQSHSRGG